MRTFEFTPQQAAFVAILHEAWLNKTPSVGIAFLAESVFPDRGNQSITATFPRNHPAIHSLIVSAGKGVWRLADPF